MSQTDLLNNIKNWQIIAEYVQKSKKYLFFVADILKVISVTYACYLNDAIFF